MDLTDDMFTANELWLTSSLRGAPHDVRIGKPSENLAHNGISFSSSLLVPARSLSKGCSLPSRRERRGMITGAGGGLN